MLSQLSAPLRWAVRLLAVEALAATAVAVFLAVQVVVGEPGRVADALALAGYIALVAAGLAGLAVALSRRKARARAPAIVLQLLAVMLAYALATGGQFWAAVPTALLGIAVATLLLTPGTHQALSGSPR